MAKTLLILTGVVNGLFVLFHVYLGIQMASWPLPAMVRGLFETFNAGGLLIMVVLAFAFLARGREVLSTGLGVALVSFGAVLYLSRAGEEFLWLHDNGMIAGVCIATGLLHAAVLPFIRVRHN